MTHDSLISVVEQSETRRIKTPCMPSPVSVFAVGDAGRLDTIPGCPPPLYQDHGVTRHEKLLARRVNNQMARVLTMLNMEFASFVNDAGVIFF